ncbi:MAG: hypothetical protein HYY05_05610 [Chloroflexi bacterium]|nr:hypothetical protein [Chloroflexota bacterium]
MDERPVVINESDRGGGGMGLGFVLGVILTVVLGIGLLWFVTAGKMFGFGANAPPDGNNPTININPPDIKIPDTITINPPASPAP